MVQEHPGAPGRSSSFPNAARPAAAARPRISRLGGPCASHPERHSRLSRARTRAPGCLRRAAMLACGAVDRAWARARLVRFSRDAEKWLGFPNESTDFLLNRMRAEEHTVKEILKRLKPGLDEFSLDPASASRGGVATARAQVQRGIGVLDDLEELAQHLSPEGAERRRRPPSPLDLGGGSAPLVVATLPPERSGGCRGRKREPPIEARPTRYQRRRSGGASLLVRSAASRQAAPPRPRRR